MECSGTLYITSDRLIRVFSHDTLEEKGLFDAGSTIDKLFCRLAGDRLFILAVLQHPRHLLVLEDMVSSPALVPQAGRAASGILNLRHSMPVGGDLKVFAEGIFVRSARGVIQYELDTSGSLRQLTQLSLEEGDDFYPFGHFFYLYRRSEHLLEVWDKERGETLASIALGGKPSFFALLREPPRRDAEGHPLEARASLYFTMAQTGPNGEIFYDGFYVVPVRASTGLFLDEGRGYALPSLADAMVLDAAKGLAYARFAQSGMWQGFDLVKGELQSGEWGKDAWPIPSEGSGISLLAPFRIQYAEITRTSDAGAMTLETVHSRAEHGRSSILYMNPTGQAVYFSSNAEWLVAELSQRSPPTALGGGLAMNDTYGGRLQFVAPYWFWQDAATGKLYVSKTISPPAWKELVLPREEEGESGKAFTRIRYTIAPITLSLSDGEGLGIWIAGMRTDESGRSHGEVALYTLALGNKGDEPAEGAGVSEFALAGPVYRFDDLEEAYEAIPLTPDGLYVAVAAGAEHLVILSRADRSDALERVHRKPVPSPLVRCERVLISPSRNTLVLAFRDERNPADPKAVFNFYDISNEIKFPMYLSQVTDIPLVKRGDKLELPLFAFARGDSVLAIALGGSGLGLLSLENPTAPVLVLETFAGEAILDVGVDASGERVCAAASDAGVLCGHFN